MLKIKQNFHTHSVHSCDGAQAQLGDIRKEMDEMGIQEYGVSDHLHTQYNLVDIESCRHDFLAQKPSRNFHFGVEASCMATAECERVASGDYQPWGDEPVYGFRDMPDFDGRMSLGITAEDVRRLGIEFVVAGVHWPLGLPQSCEEATENYYRQQLFLIAHPLVDVLAHPWDSLTAAAGGWFSHRDSAHVDRHAMLKIPPWMNDGICDALLEYGKPAEINLSVLCNETPENREFLLSLFVDWKRRGVKFTIGDDLHAAHFSPERFSRCEAWLDANGFEDSDFILPFRNKQR